MTDAHFHYVLGTKYRDYKDAIEKQCVDKGLVVIHDSQREKSGGLWLHGLREISKFCNIPAGIELSLHRTRRISKLPDDLAVIHSIHTYKDAYDWLEIFKIAVCQRNYNIRQICHPFSNELKKGEMLGFNILETFVSLCNEYKITVELNNRYLRQNEACGEFVTYIIENADNYCVATDAHEPKKIGKYGFIFELLRK